VQKIGALEDNAKYPTSICKIKECTAGGCALRGAKIFNLVYLQDQVGCVLDVQNINRVYLQDQRVLSLGVLSEEVQKISNLVYLQNEERQFYDGTTFFFHCLLHKSKVSNAPFSDCLACIYVNILIILVSGVITFRCKFTQYGSWCIPRVLSLLL
jgi:hypothetical protein